MPTKPTPTTQSSKKPIAKNTKRQAEQRFVALNRKARHEYTILETLEAGLVLTGTEVKSLRAGQVSLQESFATLKGGDLVLLNAWIAEYGQAGAHLQHDSRRPRVLLVSKRERRQIAGSITREGMTLVPLSLYFNARGRAKLELGLAKGRKEADKRDAIRTREWQRDKARILRHC